MIIQHIACVLLYLCLDYIDGRAIDESPFTNLTHLDMDGSRAWNEILVEQDILLTANQYSAINGQQNVSGEDRSPISTRKKRKAIRDSSKRWTNNRIPYTIELNTFADSELVAIDHAINEWQEYTCLIFEPAREYENNYIHFENGSYCRSFIGMERRTQFIQLGKGCRSKRTIMHEIGHAIGFYHEQSRPDRDNYVTIKLENLEDPGDSTEFRKIDESKLSTYDIPYDYESIMHYSKGAFAKRGRNTIVTHQKAYENVIGQRQGLSFGDIKLANLMYKCGEPCKTSVVKCPGDGFRGKDCQCWCPGSPVKRCNTFD